MATHTLALAHPIRQIRAVTCAAVNPPQTGLIAILGLGILYTLTCVGLYAGGAEPLAPPALPIAVREYYRWLALFTIPTFLAIWLAFSLTAHRVAHVFGGRGNLRPLLDGTGIGLALPVFVTMWLPETVMAIALLLGIVDWTTMSGWQHVPAWKIFNDGRQYLGGAWMLVLVTVAIRLAEGVSWGRAACASLAGLIPASAISYLVIR